MHAPGLSRTSPNRALIRRPWMPPEPSYLVGGYGALENAIDNLDNLDNLESALIRRPWMPPAFLSGGGVR